MSMYSLTAKQRKVYSAIESYIKLEGIPPTVREIGDLIGEKTPGAVQGILKRLEQKGVITRQPGTARSIKLTSPGGIIYADPVYVPEIKKITARNMDNLLNTYNIKKYHPVSPDLVQPQEKCFQIMCSDNSLFNSGIMEKDSLIISMSYELKEEDIVLIFYDGRTYLRRYYPCSDEDLIILKADEDLIGKDSFRKKDVKIIGKLKGKFSMY